MRDIREMHNHEVTAASLRLGQVILLVMGGSMGADLYVASAFGAHLGSGSLLVWAAGALMVMAVAMAFASCALVVPGNGGPYLYARQAFGPMAGFLAGWAVLVAEWSSLVALPVAFSRYVEALTAAAWPGWATAGARVAFLLAVALAIYRSPRWAALLTDLLTIGRLLPLVLVMLGGLAWATLHPVQATAHLLPFRAPSWEAAATMLIPVFWAYAGFEVGSIPASQVHDPHRTIPLGLLLGTAASACLYLLVNLTVMLVVPPQGLAASPAPLVSCARAVAAGMIPGWEPAPAAAEILLGAGVLISTLGTASAIAFASTHMVVAMASTGLLPRALGHLSPRYGTPGPALVVLMVPAAAASVAGDLLSIVGTAVTCSAFAYLSTALAACRLGRSRAARAAGVLAAGVSMFLFSLTRPAVLMTALALQSLGALVYLARRRVPAPSPGSWVAEFTVPAAFGLPTEPALAAVVPGPAERITPAVGLNSRFVPAAASLVRRITRIPTRPG